MQEDPSLKPDPQAACPPCWMRMTVNAIPSSPALAQKAAIPLGCILQPMAPSDEVALFIWRPQLDERSADLTCSCSTRYRLSISDGQELFDAGSAAPTSILSCISSKEAAVGGVISATW